MGNHSRLLLLLLPLRRVAAVLAILAGPALTQAAAPPTTSPTTTDARLDRFEQRLNEMEQRHRAELRARDEEIARLRTQLERAVPATSQPATRPAAAGGGGRSTATQDLIGEIEGAGTVAAGTREQVARDAAARSESPLTLSRTPVSFNPDLAVVSDFLGSYSTQRSNDAYNRVDVREVELDLRAAVDPRADGVAILSFERDVENPVFPKPGEEGDGGPDSSVNIEEAYLFLHDFGVPNLTAKLGRFHVRFGRQNILHLHDLPTSDPPFVSQAFLAPEALSDAGLSLSYVIPPRCVFGQYVEIIGEILAGEGAGSESPTLTGDLSVDSPAFNTHVLWNTNVGTNWNLELGASYLFGKRGPDNDLDLNLYGADVTLIHTDPTGRFNNTLFQGELMYANTDQAGGSTQNALGAYLLGQQQIDRDWYAGLRLDWTQDPNHDARESWGVSPYVSWYWSEFLRFRVEYQHRDGDVPNADTLYFQATWIFGAHPPHPYWAMR